MVLPAWPGASPAGLPGGWGAQVVSVDPRGAHQLAGPGGGGWARLAEVRRCNCPQLAEFRIDLTYLHLPMIGVAMPFSGRPRY